MEVKRARRSEGKESIYRGQRRLGWLFSLLLTLLVLFLLFGVWLRPMRISGDSMSPALMDGEIVLVDRLAKYWRRPARGDMVQFETADGAFIKRVVALPGETVDIQEGRVFINSRPLDESAYASNFIGDMEMITVAEGSVFVLGDNRQKIYDSRMESVGCIPYGGVEGVLRLRISPLGKFTIFF